MSSGYMAAYVEVPGPDRYAVELRGPDCRVWKGEGLPVYEGSIEGLQTEHPALLRYLLEKGYIKRSAD